MPHYILKFVLCAFLACFCLQSGAQAHPHPVSDVELNMLINTGQIDEARRRLEASNPTDADRLFLEARILKSQGELDRAIRMFRDVLRIDPNYLNARRELAHTLLLNEDYGAARFHFGALLSIDQNDTMRGTYRQFLNVIDRNDNVGFGGYFSLIPSTNVNRGTTNTVFNSLLGQGAISQSSQESSGVGAQFGASGYFRRHIGQQGRISLNWNAQTTQYEDNTYNSDVINLSLPYERVTPTGNWSIMPFYREAWYTTNADNYAAGLQFGLTRRISPRNALRFSYLYEDRRYEDLSFQNGSFTSASLSFNRQLTPSMGIEIGLSQQVSDPQVAHLQYTENGLTTALSNTWPGGLQSQFRLGYGIRDFVGDYPLTTSPREDDYYTLSVSLQHSRIDIRGFTPQLQCSHTVNNSNIAFSDYDVTECQITLSRNF